jgi:hypothetical protein
MKKHALAPLRALAQRLDDAALRALFAAIRAEDDASLLRMLRPSAPATKARDFASAIELRLKPLWASAADKAELLAVELRSTPDPKGLKPTIRALVTVHGEAAVLAAAERLLTRLATYATREKIK